jgi:hypothetical protein
MGGSKHPKVRSQNALLQGRSLWKTLLEHTVQDQIEISIKIGLIYGKAVFEKFIFFISYHFKFYKYIYIYKYALKLTGC